MIEELFYNREIIEKIQYRLPQMFHVAELESSRAGRIGMEVGSVREKIIIALLIYKFGKKNVQTDISIHQTEDDVIVYDKPISIKTMTGYKIAGFKLIWTVDREQVLRYSNEYQPKCDMLLVHICWGGNGGLYYFSKEIQSEVFNRLGRDSYLKLPRPGTNPRGVEMSNLAVETLAKHPDCLRIPVKWEKKEVNFDQYKRWVDLWAED